MAKPTTDLNREHINPLRFDTFLINISIYSDTAESIRSGWVFNSKRDLCTMKLLRIIVERLLPNNKQRQEIQFQVLGFFFSSWTQKKREVFKYRFLA